MMVAEYEEENSQSHAGDAPQDRYDDREPVRRAPVEKIGEGEGLDKGSWSRNEDSEGMDKIQEGSWFFRAS